MTIDEAKSFILWAKSNDIKSLKINDIDIHFHEKAFAVKLKPLDKPKKPDLTEEQLAEKEEKELDDLLFHSSY